MSQTYAYCAAVIGQHKVTGQPCAMYGYGNNEDKAKSDLAEHLKVYNVEQIKDTMVVVSTACEIKVDLTARTLSIS